MTFERRQQARRAAGQVGTAEVMARLEAQAPALREYAEWITDAPGGPTIPTDPIRAASELRDALLALRMLNARREIGALMSVLAEEPTNEQAPAWRARLGELTAFVVTLERSGKVRSRPWGQILERERSTPPRRPWRPL